MCIDIPKNDYQLVHLTDNFLVWQVSSRIHHYCGLMPDKPTFNKQLALELQSGEQE